LLFHLSYQEMADISRQPHKYSNRGYRLTLIEVGHAAQNISLAAIEMGISSCELGGALDGPLSRELGLDDDIVPMLAIAIGYESDEESYLDSQLLVELSDEFVGAEGPVKTIESSTYAESSFFCAIATLTKADDETAGATSTSAELAKGKAIVEAYERHISRIPRVDFVGSAKDIHSNWLDPRTIMPLTEEQISSQGLSAFDENLLISWTQGEKLDGSAIMIPSDLVYYGHVSVANQIAWSNSSGVAAFTDFGTAVDKATLEIVERDALMRNWYSRTPPLRVRYELLPIHLRNRTDFWCKQGRNVHVLLLSSVFSIVALVVIVSDQYPCFVSGAAADLSFEKAAGKAYEEAEFGLVSKLHYPNQSAIDPRSVQLPLDHGRLYALPDNIPNISWLWSGNEAGQIPLLTRSIEQIKSALDLVIVDLSESDSSIRVVRVFSDKLIPINFGFGNDHYTHGTIVNIDRQSLELPHYFA
jgi:thiazole/oxazole-forming peptide maturase SagD family component